MFDGLVSRSANGEEFRAVQQRTRSSLVALALTRRKALEREIAARSKTRGTGAIIGGTVVIGGGLHAAIFAANIQEAPIVLEKQDRLGGIFGVKPVFRLNSRNRPIGEGRDYFPGGNGTLNRLPECTLQLGDISGEEYPTDADLGLVIRVNLLQTSSPIVNARVVDLLRDRVVMADGYNVSFKRLIIATGLGAPSRPFTGACVSFETWLERTRRVPYPWDNVKRLAVIGANDSGKVVVEHALGQGPRSGYTTANTDFVERIDWYGQQSPSQEVFEQCERSRYAGIGRYMPRDRDPGHYYRVNPNSLQATGIRNNMVWTGTIANGPYDLIVVCTGFKQEIDDLIKPLVSPFTPLTEPYTVDGETVARKVPGLPIYKIGPCAEIPVGPQENLGGIPENSAALFRYCEKTEKFAKSLR